MVVMLVIEYLRLVLVVNSVKLKIVAYQYSDTCATMKCLGVKFAVVTFHIVVFLEGKSTLTASTSLPKGAITACPTKESQAPDSPSTRLHSTNNAPPWSRYLEYPACWKVVRLALIQYILDIEKNEY